MKYPAFRPRGQEFQAGDLVRLHCVKPRDVGVIVHVYEQHADLEWCVDVLWEDGVYTQNATDLEVVNGKF